MLVQSMMRIFFPKTSRNGSIFCISTISVQQFCEISYVRLLFSVIRNNRSKVFLKMAFPKNFSIFSVINQLKACNVIKFSTAQQFRTTFVNDFICFSSAEKLIRLMETVTSCELLPRDSQSLRFVLVHI